MQLSNPLHRKKIFVGLFLVFTVMVYLGICYQLLIIKWANDFALFYHAAYSVLHHQSMYSLLSMTPYHHSLSATPDHSLYSHNLAPPPFTLLMLPLGFLGPFNALLIWSLCSLALKLISVFILYKIFFQEYHRPIIFWVFLSVYLAAMPCISNFYLGQVGDLLLFAFLWFWLWARGGKDIKAGLMLGALLSIKYFFGLFALFFLLQRRISLVGAALASFILANALAYCFFGKTSFLAYWDNLHHIVWYVSNWNASLFGFFARLAGKDIGHQQFILLPWAHNAYYVCAALLIFIELKIAYKPLKNLDDFDYAFCYVLIAALLISPLGWVYYFTLLLIPLLLIIRALTYYQQSFSITALIAFIVMIMSLYCPIGMQEKIVIGWHNLGLTASNFFYALLLLLGLLFYCKRAIVDQNVSLRRISERQLLPWAIIFYCASIFCLILFASFLVWNTFVPKL